MEVCAFGGMPNIVVQPSTLLQRVWILTERSPVCQRLCGPRAGRLRRFDPFFWTQFPGAANDKLFKFPLTVMFTCQPSARW